MFKALEQDCDDNGGRTASTAALSYAQALDDSVADDPRPPRAHPREWIAARIHRFEAWCTHVDLAPDLASDIGSRKWMRGMATMLALGGTALATWPDFSAVEAAPAMPVLQREREEFLSRTIAPLAFGADSGRRMGASPLVRPLASVPERPTIQMVSTLGQGDSLQRMMERAGVGGADIALVSQLVGQAVPVGSITPGTRFDITLGGRPAPGAPRALASIDFRARFDLDLSIARGAGGNLALGRHPIAVDATPLRIRGTVGSSFYRSARNAGAPVTAIQAYLRAVDRYVSIENDLAPADSFDLVVAYRRSSKGERQIGDLLYAGIERAGKPRLQLLRWGQGGEMFPASAIGQPRSAPIGMPVAGHLTSGFGMRRHPILGYTRMHAGIDFGAAYGSPIYAVADGVVGFAGRHGGHGNYVRLEHGGGLGTGYAHMSRIAVSPGVRVHAGQVIGYVGSTGLSTGPHLHFEAYRDGRTINPAGITVTARPQIDGKQRDAFQARLKALLAVQPGAALGSVAPVGGAPVEAAREIDRLAPGKAG